LIWIKIHSPRSSVRGSHAPANDDGLEITPEGLRRILLLGARQGKPKLRGVEMRFLLPL